MERRASFFSVIIIMLLSILSGCGSNNEAANDQAQAEEESIQVENSNEEVDEEDVESRVITHEMGDTTITGTPTNVVVLEFSFVDALASLGISPIGIADDGDEERIIGPIAEKISDYTSVGARKEPSLEVIASLQPDLIIADLNRHKDSYEELSEIAPTIVLSSLSANYEENVESFPIIAEALGATELADERTTDHNELLAELKSKVPSDESRTFLPAVVTDTGFHAHSSTSYTGSLLETLGLKNAIQGEGVEDATNKIDLETLVEHNPDIIFLMTGDEETIISEWEENPLWEEISAVKNDQVYKVDQNEWSRFRGLIAAELIVQDTIDLLYEN
ncbi:iron citrate ABC transporter substrate-binding protein [Salipaludibacillus neizhouensis]|uniref:Iron citrate ABC transporter substrate-binding protein n=1 Tax=Salipaludibacillus neizhouensis TaxID=885475 RepID=A0A3A9K2E6_9BACI|nr:Fe(3+) dicitrate ABC transporter substrate-binding protein [Salipaludibacillus neizhouensis]RKL65378.1 iron citrate ABC transporter substrate-binding protein [Salipaludibacillus neizhouensis]